MMRERSCDGANVVFTTGVAERGAGRRAGGQNFGGMVGGGRSMVEGKKFTKCFG